MAGKRTPLPDKAEQSLRELEKCQPFHDTLVKDVEKRWHAFEGRMDVASDAAAWTSQLHPPYLNHIVETAISGLMDDKFSFRVKPLPRFYDEGEYAAVKAGAEAHEILFRSQLNQDRFNELQRPHALQAAVTRLSVIKTFWEKSAKKTKRLVTVNAAPPELAAMGVVLPKLVEEDYTKVSSGPVSEVVDVRDFYWHEAAVSLEKARWVAHAVWMSLEDLKKLAERGVYDPQAVRDLSEPRGGDYDSDVERDRENRGRKKDMIEVLEIWNRESETVTTLAGRKVLLRHKKWPFWHGEYPFVVSSLQPFPFSLQGTSIVDKLMHLQEAAWDLMNQRHDSLRLINNFITAISVDLVDDINSLVYEPGARWPVTGDAQMAVQQITPDPTPVTVSLPAESILKTDMQNLAGGSPFTSTSEAAKVGADTATEAALVTNLAQRAQVAMKQQLYAGYRRVGSQRLQLNQQFIREPVYVDRIGLNQQMEQMEILPYMLEGEYLFDLSPMSESLMRTEKRAENQALFQIMAESQAVVAASGSPWNMKAAQERLLESYDVEDKEAFFTDLAPGATPAIGGGQPQPQPQQEGGGVTAQQSIDPATSPSNQSSMSPAVFAQRAGAMRGGVANG